MFNAIIILIPTLIIMVPFCLQTVFDMPNTKSYTLIAVVTLMIMRVWVNCQYDVNYKSNSRSLQNAKNEQHMTDENNDSWQDLYKSTEDRIFTTARQNCATHSAAHDTYDDKFLTYNDEEENAARRLLDEYTRLLRANIKADNSDGQIPISKYTKSSSVLAGMYQWENEEGISFPTGKKIW